MNKKIGIVLSGGGAKCAFQIGVLKILLEKINKEGDVLHAITGTSGGAMNAAFVASGQFNDLERIWLSWNKKNCPLIRSKWYGDILTTLTRGYMYNSETLKDFFIKNLNINALMESPIRYVNTRVKIDDGEVYFGGNIFQKNNPELTIKEIMASMAFIPFADSVEIEGHRYIDGGFRDTIPVKAIIQNNDKLDKIFIINVNTNKKKWSNKIFKNSNVNLLGRSFFAFNDVIWDESNRSDIEIGRLRFWNQDEYKVIYPEFVNTSTTTFESDLIREAYLHGIEIANFIAKEKY